MSDKERELGKLFTKPSSSSSYEPNSPTRSSRDRPPLNHPIDGGDSDYPSDTSSCHEPKPKPPRRRRKVTKITRGSAVGLILLLVILVVLFVLLSLPSVTNWFSTRAGSERASVAGRALIFGLLLILLFAALAWATSE